MLRPAPLLASITLHLLVIGVISTDTVHKLCQLNPSIEITQIDLSLTEEETPVPDECLPVPDENISAPNESAPVPNESMPIPDDPVTIPDKDIDVADQSFAREEVPLPPAPAQAYIEAPPSPVNMIRPVYPLRARRRGEEGTVLIEISVNPLGAVENAVVVESSGFQDLDAAALKSALNAQFIPAQRNNEAVAGIVRLPFSFRLNKTPNR